MKRIFITIYILLLGTLFTIPFGLGPIIGELFEDEVRLAEREFSRGTFWMIAQRLEGLDPDAAKQELTSLQPKFGYPLNLRPLAEMDIDDDEMADFLNGLIVAADPDDALVMRLGQSDYAISMGGPWPDKDLNTKATILFLLLFVICLTVPALAWTFFLNRDIRKIEKSTDQFAAGRHDARVKVSRISSMTGISDAFNAMAEKTQKLIASQKDLANSVSHEIRTPLARIKFSLEMAGADLETNTGGKTDATGGDTDYLDEIGKDVEEIESLVDEMLTYARFEREPEHSGRLSNHEMVSWLENLVQKEQKTAPGKDIFYLPATDHFIARFEPVYLGWAVRNLLRNGVKHSRTKVVLTFSPTEDSALIHVDDDGFGIPDRDREKIFQPFFRLDKSRSRASGGYGLGLAIAKRIITWHKGSIEVANAPSGGARFTLMLPINTTQQSG
ncbi:MAG: ATP-binding protein [Desulfobacterales bacterium]|nr:ATP-binding protein [Desulfobacterales bacterium]